MAEEAMDANQGSEPSVEPNVEPQAAENNAPAAANAAPQQKEDSLPFHQHPRFQELISEKNELKDKLSTMERLLQERDQPAKPSPMELAKKELVDLGIEDKAAERIVNSIKLVSDASTESRVAPVEQVTAQREVDNWLKDFSKEHKDFNELEPKMNETFKALPERTQTMLASDPMALELLYNHVKAQQVKEEVDKAYRKGVEDGYKNKQNKASGSPGSNGSANPPGEISRKSIAEMSLEEYKKNRTEIMANLAKLQGE